MEFYLPFKTILHENTKQYIFARGTQHNHAYDGTPKQLPVMGIMWKPFHDLTVRGCMLMLLEIVIQNSSTQMQSTTSGVQYR